MKTVSIHDAKTNLSKYIAAAKRGENIGIGAYGKQEVWLTIHQPRSQKAKTIAAGSQATKPKPRRQFGTMRGKIWVGPDAFSPETEAEITRLMTEGSIFPDAD